jgi:hypothetical protein
MALHEQQPAPSQFTARDSYEHAQGALMELASLSVEQAGEVIVDRARRDRTSVKNAAMTVIHAAREHYR